MLENLLRILDDAEFQMMTKNAADSVPKTIVAEYLKSIRAAIPANPTRPPADNHESADTRAAHRAVSEGECNDVGSQRF